MKSVRHTTASLILLAWVVLAGCAYRPQAPLADSPRAAGPAYVASSDSLVRSIMEGSPERMPLIANGRKWFSASIYTNPGTDEEALERFGFANCFQESDVVFSCLVPWGINLDRLPPYVTFMRVDDGATIPPPVMPDPIRVPETPPSPQPR